MLFNEFVLKKYAAFILVGFLPVLAFYICVTFFGFWVGLGALFPVMAIAILLGFKLMKNPFTSMLEGKGLLVFDLNSTGVLRMFIVKVLQPYISGNLGKEVVNDVYDRKAVINLAKPIQAGKAIIKLIRSEIQAGKNIKDPLAAPIEEQPKMAIDIQISEEEFNKSRFGFYHYPVLIYNSQIKSLITKDFLSEAEKQSFAEHGVLYLNRKLEELTALLRDFGRYIVELTKPQSSILNSKWLWIAIVAVIIVLGLMFAKPLYNVIAGMDLSSAKSALDSAAPVVIRGQ